ncbi:MAG: 6-phosphogluconolactonase [Solirubrobacteraceae bacterium]
MTAVDVTVVEDPARACADALLAAARARPDSHIVLSGGSSPKAAYRLVAAEDPHAFAGAILWFGDERCVAPDDERANYRMAVETLLDPLAAAGVKPVCHRIPAEGGPEVAALAYERLLRNTWRAGAPAFDLVLAGIGPDGHTLSLFPGQPSVTERERLVVGVTQAGLEPFVPRVSLTLPALAGTARVVVLATGAGKVDAVARAFGEGAVPDANVPASMLASAVAPGALTVLLDAAAAERL